MAGRAFSRRISRDGVYGVSPHAQFAASNDDTSQRPNGDV